MPVQFKPATLLSGKKAVACLAILVPLALWPSFSLAQSPPPSKSGSFALYWENDLFSGTDRDYTNGLKLTYSRPYQDAKGLGRGGRDWADNTMDVLPLVNDKSSHRAVSYSLGQDIYTPENTRRSDLIRNDRPYAGYSYIGVGFHARRGSQRHVWEVDLGVVGPLSFGEQLQNLVHEIVGSEKARGWKHQLNNEPALNVIWETKWRLGNYQRQGGLGFDFIPHLGGRIGNVAAYANTGAEIRLGWFLPENFGSCPIRPGCDLAGAADIDEPATSTSAPLGFHLFASLDGRMVLRDIFLDGNTFTDSHSVTKETFVADLMTGVVLSFRRFRLSYAYVFRTREFKQQNKAQVFGALNVVYFF